MPHTPYLLPAGVAQFRVTELDTESFNHIVNHIKRVVRHKDVAFAAAWLLLLTRRDVVINVAILVVLTFRLATYPHRLASSRTLSGRRHKSCGHIGLGYVCLLIADGPPTER